jgi:CRP-like cAMP-binding protein
VPIPSQWSNVPVINPLIAKLSRSGALRAADHARLEEVSARHAAVAAREDIIREGDPPADVHLVMDGFAYRYKLMPGGRRAIMALLIPGDFCDLDVAILERMDHTIGTLTPCSIVEIPRATVNELVERHPNIDRALRWATLVDEAILREWLANMGQRAADRQMAHLLCELRIRLAVVGMADAHGMHLPMTQEDMGDMLGISTVHVNRVLQQLKDQDLIRLNGRNFAMPDLAKLERFAEFNADYLHLIASPAVPRT